MKINFKYKILILDLLEESKEPNEVEKKNHVKTEDKSLSCSLQTRGKNHSAALSVKRVSHPNKVLCIT